MVKKKPYRYIDNTIVPKKEVRSAFENGMLSEASQKRYIKNNRRTL